MTLYQLSYSREMLSAMLLICQVGLPAPTCSNLRLASAPTGSRTPVFGLRTRRPRPLDDGGVAHAVAGGGLGLRAGAADRPKRLLAGKSRTSFVPDNATAVNWPAAVPLGPRAS